MTINSKKPGTRGGPRLDRKEVKTAPGAPNMARREYRRDSGRSTGREYRRDRGAEARRLKEAVATEKNLVRAHRACEAPDRSLPRDVATTTRIKLDCQRHLTRREHQRPDRVVTSRLAVPEEDSEYARKVREWMARADAISRRISNDTVK